MLSVTSIFETFRRILSITHHNMYLLWVHIETDNWMTVVENQTVYCFIVYILKKNNILLQSIHSNFFQSQAASIRRASVLRCPTFYLDNLSQKIIPPVIWHRTQCRGNIHNFLFLNHNFCAQCVTIAEVFSQSDDIL